MTTPDYSKMDPATEDERNAYHERTAAEMRANGQVVEETFVFEDYFTFDERHRWFFPDGKHYIEYQAMTEGERRKYQTKIMSVMTMNKSSGDSKIGINIARDRAALLDCSVKGWFMEMRNEMGQIVEVRFDDKRNGWARWSENANPKWIESLERAIRKVNPWLQAEMSLQEIDAEIERLRELREEKALREMGELDSLSS